MNSNVIDSQAKRDVRTGTQNRFLATNQGSFNNGTDTPIIGLHENKSGPVLNNGTKVS